MASGRGLHATSGMGGDMGSGMGADHMGADQSSMRGIQPQTRAILTSRVHIPIQQVPTHVWPRIQGYILGTVVLQVTRPVVRPVLDVLKHIPFGVV